VPVVASTARLSEKGTGPGRPARAPMEGGA